MSFLCPIVADQEVRKLGARETIENVIAEHRLHRDDFFGQHRDPHLVAARRDAAQRLSGLGFPSTLIARAMKRNHTTILNYLPHIQQRKAERYAAKRIVKRLAPDMAALVVAFAKAEQIPVEQLIVRWIADRAEGEGYFKGVPPHEATIAGNHAGRDKSAAARPRRRQEATQERQAKGGAGCFAEQADQQNLGVLSPDAAAAAANDQGRAPRDAGASGGQYSGNAAMKTFTKQDVRCVSTVDEGLMLALWRKGMDTLDIARHLGLTEWQVFNRLLHLREARR